MIVIQRIGKILVFCLGFLNPSFGQYSFSTANEGFNYLNASATNVTADSVWGLDDTAYYIPLGFSMSVDSVSYDSIKVNASSTLIEFFQNCNFKDDLNGPLLVAFLTGLVDRGRYFGNSDVPMSPVSYLTEGTTGDRIFKLEWKNAGFWNGDYRDYINFQLWLYEAIGIIEIRFGQNNNPTNVWLTHPDGPMTFFTYKFKCTPIPESVKTIWLHGNKDSPEFTIVDSVNPAPLIVYLSGAPKNGTIYRFVPADVSVDNEEHPLNIVIYPNPFEEYTVMEISSNNIYEARLEIYNQLGKLVQTKPVRIPGATKIFREGFPAGIYFYRLVQDNGVLASGKIIAK